jgi:hypothetical protein
MKIRFIVLIICGLITLNSNAQTNKTVITDLVKQGELDWTNDNYKLSVLSYEKLVNLVPDNKDYKYRYGVSNFMAGFDPEKSLRVLEPLVGNADAPSDVAYWIAQVYMYLYEFTDAIDMFNTFISSPGIDPKKIKDAQRFIEMCESAVLLMNKPVNVSFENLGPNINSSSNDFNPFVPENEEFIVFTSDKKYDEGSRMFDQNIYISYPEKGAWSFAKPLEYINTIDPEKTVGLSPDGKKMFICGSFSKIYSDVNTAELKGKQFKFGLDDGFFKNLGNKLTTGASSPVEDKIIYFTAFREETKGEGDIYYIKMLPDGKWGTPKNLGDEINTEYDEMCPSISPDGKTLYFSSKGHNSMGGYDLFVSHLNEITGEWAKPINVGYPINTPGDDFIISFSKDRRYAYTSSVRKEGQGGHDIYRITFKDVDEPLTVIKGKIKVSNGTSQIPWNKSSDILDISVYDKHMNLFGKYIYNKNLGRFVSILPKGEYKLVIQADGCEEYSETITVLERNLYKSEIDKEFLIIEKK